MAIAVPAIVANITTPLLSIMDVAITGHLGGADHIAAIAIGSTMFNVIYWLMGFLRMGTSGLTAQACGAGDDTLISGTLARSLAVSVLIGVAVVMLQRPLCSLGLYFMDTGGATREYARQYFNICIWGAPAVMATYSLTGWFIGMQNSHIPMVVSIAINIINLAVSLVLTGVCGMKIAGVAIGTLTAQWAGLLLALWLLHRQYRPKRVNIAEIVSHRHMMRFFSVNRDIFIRTACLVAVTLWFTRSGSAEGARILAANTLLLQIFTLFSYFMDGFAYSGEALCGRFSGAGDKKSLHRCISTLIVIGAVFALLFTGITAATGRHGLALLTSDTAVVDDAMVYLPWAIAVPAFGFLAFTYDGICIGLTHTRAMLLSMVSATVAFFTTWAIMTPHMGNNGLWASFIIYLGVRSAVLSFITRMGYSTLADRLHRGNDKG